eukprot:TRINITY_DN7474_c0_g1_i8.p1 TRINITY_DN7474_c0_g1~~TRINITY_DN7474_c0_g1_i8.p1  ORF type:complete len:377 (-),score=88.33 TRINITY_DN7474_c0_g1_i8:95-1225(-)
MLRSLVGSEMCIRDRFGKPDWRPGMNATGHAESPAQHRFPVWWTGDGVDLQASMESMVDSGVHDLKPYVHSDCGGDSRPKEGGDLLRWTAHCVFGTILRFHGSDHRPWTYGQHVQDVIKSYLDTRYKLVPSLIAAGHAAALSGHPLVARCDLFWPEHPEAATNQQYIWLNDTLIAPIFDSSTNTTSRKVWIPPGDWQDGWDGSVVTGPVWLTASQPYERIPLWHRRNSSLVVTTSNPGLRVQDQDWSELTLEVFPANSTTPVTTHKYMVEQTASQELTQFSLTSSATAATLLITPEHDTPRSFLVRVHLRPEHTVEEATLDGTQLPNPIPHLKALESTDYRFPFEGAGTAPAAGSVAEIRVPTGAGQPRELSILMA